MSMFTSENDTLGLSRFVSDLGSLKENPDELEETLTTVRTVEKDLGSGSLKSYLDTLYEAGQVGGAAEAAKVTQGVESVLEADYSKAENPQEAKQNAMDMLTRAFNDLYADRDLSDRQLEQSTRKLIEGVQAADSRYRYRHLPHWILEIRLKSGISSSLLLKKE
ncbi:MAG: hypothetical protein MZV63_30655 [Marinilabiliales bacterium]|nr:hypothetical protein [Marinilabiliales bacterium]